jgi:hypothetical protein
LFIVCLGACSEETQARIQQEIDAGSDQPVETTAVILPTALVDEQELFDEMWAEAAADGELSSDEVLGFARESVECTRRAGFDSELEDFSPANAIAVFSVEASGPSEGPAERAADACQNTFYLPALLAFRDQG